AAGVYHTVALKVDGTVWAWGGNSHGDLGDGTTTDQYTPVQVSALNLADPCSAGVAVCNAGTGLCAATPSQPDGSPCNDDNACTQTDTCQAGVCTGANPVVCAAPDQCHLVGTCDPGTGMCSAPVAKADGSACDDGDACTQADSCQAGACTGANPVVCVTPDQ